MALYLVGLGQRYLQAKDAERPTSGEGIGPRSLQEVVPLHPRSQNGFHLRIRRRLRSPVVAEDLSGSHEGGGLDEPALILRPSCRIRSRRIDARKDDPPHDSYPKLPTMGTRTAFHPLYSLDQQIHFPSVHRRLDLRSGIFEPRRQTLSLLHPCQGWLDQDPLG